MIRFFILPTLIILVSSSGFSQSEATPIQLEAVRSSYRGCCSPVVLSPARCTPRSIIYTEQVIQGTEESKEVLDITDPEISLLGASPNPTKGRLSVSVAPSLIGYEIQVFDMTGRFVGSPIPITGTSEEFTIEGKSGVYLIVVRTEKEVITERILLDTQ